ncbi:MAG: glycosyltransferase family 4 protein [Anaerofustis sp.]
MRVAIFTDTFSPQINGIANTLNQLTSYFQSKGIEYLLFAPDYGETESRLKSEPHVVRLRGHRFLLYPECSLAFPNFFRQRERIRHFRPDVIHVTTEYGIGTCGQLIAKDLNIPLVTSYHTNFDRYLEEFHLALLKRPYWSYMKRFHGQARITLCPSQDTLCELSTRGFSHLGIWSRGVDLSRFHPKYRSEDTRAMLGAEGRTVFLYVGRISKEKGLDVLVRSILMINKRYEKDCLFVFTGDGPYLEELRSQQLPNAVFTGALKGEALSSMYASSDVFVFPSGTETFGNVALEAMASGLALICVDSGGVTDFANHRQNAYIAKWNSHKSLARAMQALLKDAALRTRLGQSGFATAMGRTWETIFNSLIETYQSVAAEKKETKEMVG